MHSKVSTQSNKPEKIPKLKILVSRILSSQRELQIILSTELPWDRKRSPIHVELSILMYGVRMKCECVRSFGKITMYSKPIEAGIIHVPMIGFNTKLHHLECINIWLLQHITKYKNHAHISQMTLLFSQVKAQNYQSWKTTNVFPVYITRYFV